MKFVCFSGLALLTLAGCSNRNIDSLDAVKQGVIRDIGKNLNVGAMDVSVVSVSFRDKEADAVVSFAPKGRPASEGLTMNYTMERQGNEWHIKKRAQGDLQRHAAQAPQGSMGAAPNESGSQLPPGHPSTSGQGQNLPPGHPPLGDGAKQ